MNIIWTRVHWTELYAARRLICTAIGKAGRKRSVLSWDLNWGRDLWNPKALWGQFDRRTIWNGFQGEVTLIWQTSTVRRKGGRECNCKWFLISVSVDLLLFSVALLMHLDGSWFTEILQYLDHAISNNCRGLEAQWCAASPCHVPYGEASLAHVLRDTRGTNKKWRLHRDAEGETDCTIFV